MIGIVPGELDPRSIGVLLTWLLIGCPSGDEGTSDAASSSTSVGTATTSSTDVGSTSLSTTGDPTVADTTGPGSTGPVESSGSSESSGSAGSSSESSGSSSGGVVEACGGPEALLYAQGPSGASPGTPSATSATGSYRSADDFEVDGADGCWCVSRVVLFGEFVDSMLGGELEIAFHDDDAGLPLDPPIAQDMGTPTDVDGVLDYSLASPVELPAGIYWLSATPEIPDVDVGIWWWLPSDVSFGSSWALLTDSLPPPECQGWVTGSSCIPTLSFTDLAFELHGVVGGGGCG